MLRRFKILSVLLLIFIILLKLSGSTFANSVKSLENQRQDIKRKINEQKSKIQSINKEKDLIAKEISVLDSELEIASLELQEVETDLQGLEVSIKETEEKLIRTEESLSKNLDAFAERINFIYKTPDYTYLELLLNSDCLEDYLSKKNITTCIAEQDNELLNKIKAEKAEIEENKILLAKQKELTEQKKYELNDKRTKLVAATRDKKVYMEKLNQNKEELEQSIKKFNKEANALTDKIKALQSKNTKYTGGKLAWPVPSSGSISSHYGNRFHPILKKNMFHSGIDIPAKSGSSIVAAESGKVIYSGWYSSYGKVIMIDHGGGIVTLYGHCSSLDASVGQSVKKGQKVARIGSTGRSTGPHLHFEVRKNGSFQNPKSWLGK